MSKPDIKWIDFNSSIHRVQNPLIEADDAKTYLAYNHKHKDHMPAYVEHSAYEKAIAAMKIINKNQNTAGACMHIARKTLKELGEDGE